VRSHDLIRLLDEPVGNGWPNQTNGAAGRRNANSMLADTVAPILDAC